ncbi:MAG: patatin-like phospholipase family protein [Bdellovibrionales bacterium]|nr:patatin-like phospholipase family protein [Bdellovibrionales bacterium]
MAPEKLQRALVMTGGGARGAYQAGVLKYISENVPGAHFDTLVGASAGAINIAGLAAHKGCVFTAGPHIAQLWSNLRMNQVFRTDFLSLMWIGLRWLYDLLFGGVLGKPMAHGFVDTKPLAHLLERELKLENIDAAIDEGNVRHVAISCTEVYTGCLVTFVQSKEFQDWFRARKRSRRARIRVEHIMASAAIPLLFPSRLVGNRRYVDGCIRATTPLSPAARLGADKILAVGVRQYYTEEFSKDWLAEPAEPEPKASISQRGALVLNSLFAENLDADVDHLDRLNKTLGNQRLAGFKPIDILVIRPSVDLGRMAVRFHEQLPPLVRYLLRGLGSEAGETSDILSYLLFTPDYLTALVNLGYEDAKIRHAEIAEFFSDRRA